MPDDAITTENPSSTLMQVRSLKYGSPFIVYAAACYAFLVPGWIVFIPLIYAWVFIPLAELLIPPDPTNMDAAEEELAKRDPVYDFWLYLIVPLQFMALWLFFRAMLLPGQTWWVVTARIFDMGLLCGVFGINVAHELGHRVTAHERFLAKALLLTSLYMHFFIEHNKGHHKRVSTPEDPASARYGETLYHFFLRSIPGSWLSAWDIQRKDLAKKGSSFWSLQNEMLRFQVIQLLFLTTILLLFGWWPALAFSAASLIGALLLETVNYIEHYGLQRKRTDLGGYERPQPEHSWNSNHLLGRLTLFELSRHSDHHYQASRKYQLLRHHDHSPQMPTGYPGMMILALFPPAWFRVMHRELLKIGAIVSKNET
jgi:alkane 1-monooxygenase